MSNKGIFILLTHFLFKYLINIYSFNINTDIWWKCVGTYIRIFIRIIHYENILSLLILY